MRKQNGPALTVASTQVADIGLLVSMMIAAG